MSIRILLADDHAILRQGLKAILAGEAGLEVVGEAENGRQAVEMADRLCPDVVVMDIAMPDLNGVEATRRLLADNPKLKIIALSTYTTRQFVQAMLEAGAVGYVIKASASDELMRAIQTTINNQRYLSTGLDDMVKAPADRKVFNGLLSVYDVLSPREREVLQLLAEGHTSKVIAANLGISENTVEVHRRNIMKKLNLKTVAELTKYAVREGLTTL